MQKRSLLLVEDDLPIASILRQRLEQEGFELLLASDGEEGLRLAFKFHPKVVLLDIVMPKVDGLAVLRKLRQDEWGKTVNVVMLTNLSNGESEREAARYNVKDYIIKTDLQLSELVKKINSWM